MLEVQLYVVVKIRKGSVNAGTLKLLFRAVIIMLCNISLVISNIKPFKQHSTKWKKIYDNIIIWLECCKIDRGCDKCCEITSLPEKCKCLPSN